MLTRTKLREQKCLEPDRFSALVGLLPIGATAENPTFEIEREINSIKAALTYGDEALSNSLVLQTLDASETLMAHESLSASELLAPLSRFLLVLRNDRDVNPALQRLQALDQEKSKLKQADVKAVRSLAKTLQPYAARALAELNTSDFPELKDSGHFHLRPYPVVSSVEALAKEFLDWIVSSVGDANVFPLMDSRIASHVAALNRNTRPLSGREVRRRGLEMAIQSHAITSLPYIKFITIPEILRLRKELRSSLLNFRATISKLARIIETDSWGAELDQEIARVKREELEPACRQIHSDFANNAFVRHLFERVFVSPPALASNGFLASTLSGVGYLCPGIAPLDVNAVMPVLAGAFGLSASSATALRDKMLEERRIKENPLFYLYEISQAGRK